MRRSDRSLIPPAVFIGEWVNGYQLLLPSDEAPEQLLLRGTMVEKLAVSL